MKRRQAGKTKNVVRNEVTIQKKKVVRNDIMDSGVIGVWQQIGLNGEVELTKPTPNKWDKDDDDLDGHLKCSS